MEPTSEPLRLTQPFWIALGFVLLVGVAGRMRGRGEVETLPYMHRERPVAVPAIGQTHFFPQLGIAVTPPEGWSYLSLTDDSVADRPTFVHRSAHSIVALRPFRLVSWPPNQHEVIDIRHAHVAIEWVPVDHRRAGRFTENGSDVLILVITHQLKSKMNPEVGSFCDGIQLIEESIRP